MIVAAVLYFIGYFNPTSAGLYIESIPNASVFVNNEEVGRTPYKATSDQGEMTIKLVPESFETPLAPYETKISLVSGVETIITREFGQTTELSGGEVLSFERVDESQTGLSVITNPDSGQVIIDGSVKGFAPFRTTSLTEGEHLLEIKREGYITRGISINIQPGYKLIAVVKLAPSPNIPEEQPIEDEEKTKPKEEVKKVTIVDTGVGFLRVRKEPSTLGEEVARVIPGRDYVLLETDEDTGWYKIVYDAGEEGSASSSGWVSNTYAKKVGESGADEISSVTPTPEN
jgi:hypothetical protein